MNIDDRAGPSPDGWSRPRPPSEPIFNIPKAALAVVGVLVLVHLGRLALSPETDFRLLSALAVVPARFSLEFGWLDQQRIVQELSAGLTPGQAADRLAVARYFVDGAGPRWLSLLGYGLLHAGLAHLAMNCLWLIVFGSPLARRLGGVRFVSILGLGTVAGAFAHILTHGADVAPLVGASAGVSAATGAAARFVFTRGLSIDRMADDAAVRALPALSLAGIARNRQSLMFILLWFGTNWLFGAGVLAFGDDEPVIAWQAHIGGFMAGLLLFPWLDRAARRS